MNATQKKVVIIAGPNGAGKTTFARAFLPNKAGCPHFLFETTLSGLVYARRITGWRGEGYTVKLILLKLSTVEEALARVAMRVRQGRHHVPADVVRRRFDAGWRHFDGIYRHRVDYWQCFDNSGPTPLLLSEGANP